MEYRYNEFTLQQVYRQIGSDLAGEIIQMWIDSNVLDRHEARLRVSEVFLTIRNRTGLLMGIITVYTGNFFQSDNPYWFLRMFIRPDFRGNFNLLIFAVTKTVEALSRENVATCCLKGIVIIAENQKLQQRGGHRLLLRVGFTFYGKGPRGNDIWYIKFD